MPKRARGSMGIAEYAKVKRLAKKWKLVGEFVRLVAISSRVKNLEAPINLCLVGPPGDGKTKMLMRAQSLPHVRVFSDISPKGVLSFLDLVKNGFVSTLVIGDLGTVIGRKMDVDGHGRIGRHRTIPLLPTRRARAGHH